MQSMAHKTIYRILSYVLIVTLILTMIPISVYATEGGEPTDDVVVVSGGTTTGPDDSSTASGNSIVQPDGTTDPDDTTTDPNNDGGTIVPDDNLTASGNGISLMTLNLLAVNETTSTDVAKVTTADGSTVSSHTTLSDAITAATTDSATVTLLRNVEIDTPLTITNTIILDLAGHTITYTGEDANSVITVSSGTLTIQDTSTGGTITGNNKSGSVLTVATGATLKLTGGIITGGTATNGGGVSLAAGNSDQAATFEMSGGTISGNTATGAKEMDSSADVKGGGGVYVGSYATFTMLGGATISGNTATPTETESNGNGGGGVYVGSYATFTMLGGATISGNTVTSATGATYAYCVGGGVYVTSNGNFEMSGNATITNNAAKNASGYEGNGGGVYFASNGTFTMSGTATISNNTAADYGGGVYMTLGGFTMSDSTTICNNTADEFGGGVYMASRSFEMSGNATISNNRATQYGGGVYLVSGTFNMNSGTIGGADGGNTASIGGGIYISDGSPNIGSVETGSTSNTANTAKITHNTATLYGGGVYLDRALLTMNGIVEITDNTSGGSKSNLYLSNTKTGEMGGRISFDTDFNTETSSIGITQLLTEVGFTYQASETFKEEDKTSQKVFIPDSENYTVGTIVEKWITDRDTGEYIEYTEYTLNYTGNSKNLFGGGSGTSSDPYLISTLAHLKNLSAYIVEESVNGKYYKQTNNITITEGYTPIGTEAIGFTGNYHGNGYTISGSIQNEVLSNQGIFGYIGKDGTVKNLTTSLAVTGGDSVGGIAGINYGTIESCYNIGAITSTKSNVGGIVGMNYGIIQYCYNAGTIKGDMYVGGIAGQNIVMPGSVLSNEAADCGSILHCYNIGTISVSGSYVGGITGKIGGSSDSTFNNGGVATIQYCYNIGSCYNSSENVNLLKYNGGIAGQAGDLSTIQYCYYLNGTELAYTLNNDGNLWPDLTITQNTSLTLEQMTGDVALMNMATLFAQKKADGSTIWYINETGTPHFIPPVVIEEEVTTTLSDTWYTVLLTSTEGGCVARNGSGYVADNEEGVEFDREFYGLTTIKMQAGTSSTFFIFPGSGYVIAGIYVDGIYIGTMDTYLLENIQEDQWIQVEFVPISTGETTDIEEKEEEVIEVSDLDSSEGEEEVVEAPNPNLDSSEGEEEVVETPDPVEPNQEEAPEERKSIGPALMVGGIVAAVLALGGFGFWFFKGKRRPRSKG